MLQVCKVVIPHLWKQELPLQSMTKSRSLLPCKICLPWTKRVTNRIHNRSWAFPLSWLSWPNTEAKEKITIYALHGRQASRRNDGRVSQKNKDPQEKVIWRVSLSKKSDSALQTRLLGIFSSAAYNADGRLSWWIYPHKSIDRMLTY